MFYPELIYSHIKICICHSSKALKKVSVGKPVIRAQPKWIECIMYHGPVYYHNPTPIQAYGYPVQQPMAMHVSPQYVQGVQSVQVGPGAHYYRPVAVRSTEEVLPVDPAYAAQASPAQSTSRIHQTQYTRHVFQTSAGASLHVQPTDKMPMPQGIAHKMQKISGGTKHKSRAMSML